MLKWLPKPFTQAAEDLDSLGSEKGLKALLARLPVTDPIRTVQAISEPFEKSEGLNIRSDRLRRALKHLDERAQESISAVWNSIFDAKDARAISDTAWLVLARYYRNVHTGYRFCLDALPARESRTDADRVDAVLLACRAMAALGKHKAV